MNRQDSTWPGTGRDDHQAGPRAAGRGPSGEEGADRCQANCSGSFC